MSDCTNIQNALLRYIIKYAGIKKRPWLSLCCFIDSNNKKYVYPLYIELMDEHDKEKIKKLLKENFNIDDSFIKQDNSVISYLLDSDTYLNLVTLLKISGEARSI